jgi:hypothetical protein
MECLGVQIFFNYEQVPSLMISNFFILPTGVVNKKHFSVVQNSVILIQEVAAQGISNSEFAVKDEYVFLTISVEPTAVAANLLLEAIKIQLRTIQIPGIYDNAKDANI